LILTRRIEKNVLN